MTFYFDGRGNLFGISLLYGGILYWLCGFVPYGQTGFLALLGLYCINMFISKDHLYGKREWPAFRRVSYSAHVRAHHNRRPSTRGGTGQLSIFQ